MTCMMPHVRSVMLWLKQSGLNSVDQECGYWEAHHSPATAGKAARLQTGAAAGVHL